MAEALGAIDPSQSDRQPARTGSRRFKKEMGLAKEEGDCVPRNTVSIFLRCPSFENQDGGMRTGRGDEKRTGDGLREEVT